MDEILRCFRRQVRAIEIFLFPSSTSSASHSSITVSHNPVSYNADGDGDEMSFPNNVLLLKQWIPKSFFSSRESVFILLIASWSYSLPVHLQLQLQNYLTLPLFPTLLLVYFNRILFTSCSPFLSLSVLPSAATSAPKVTYHPHVVQCALLYRRSFITFCCPILFHFSRITSNERKEVKIEFLLKASAECVCVWLQCESSVLFENSYPQL